MDVHPKNGIYIAIDPWPYFEDYPYFEMVTFPSESSRLVGMVSWTSQLQLGIQAEIFCGITSNWWIITLTQNVGNMIVYIMDDGMVQHLRSPIFFFSIQKGTTCPNSHGEQLFSLFELPWIGAKRRILGYQNQIHIVSFYLNSNKSGIPTTKSQSTQTKIPKP